MSEHEIPLSRPDITEEEERLVLEVLRSGRLSIGPMQEEFEALVSTRAGCAHGIAVSSGTAGLFCVLRALGIGEGDEVITTPLSFVASANAILHAGAKPVFVDIDPLSLNMDPQRIEDAATDRTRAIMAVEAFGNPARMEETARVAEKLEIPLIEDSCEALGASERGTACGSFGRAGVFGFYPNKQITTGEGGMVVTDDDRLAEVCRSLRNQGRSGAVSGAGGGKPGAGTGGWLDHERLGYNFRLSEIAAALGVAQMQRLDGILRNRRRVADLYMESLMDASDVVLPSIEPDVRMSWFVFVVRLEAGYNAEERDRVIDGLRAHEIGAANYFPCIHLLPFYKNMFGYQPGSFPVAESVSQRTIALPFHPLMTRRDVELVRGTLTAMIGRENLNRG